MTSKADVAILFHDSSSGRRGRPSVRRGWCGGRVTGILGFAAAAIAWGRLVLLGVWFPPTKLNTLGTTPEFVEHNWGRARVHRIVPKKPAHGIERAIYVVDTIINPDRVAILDPIFDHRSNLSALD